MELRFAHYCYLMAAAFALLAAFAGVVAVGLYHRMQKPAYNLEYIDVQYRYEGSLIGLAFVGCAALALLTLGWAADVAERA
jgi:hypothetical protein